MGERERKGARGAADKDASRALGANARDPVAQRLTKMNARLGNDAVGQLLQQGNATRQELLQFIHTRLSTIRELQVRELDLVNNHAQRDWWRQVGDKHKSEYHKPEPTRWRESARTYADALQMLCTGNLDRGARLLERAIAEEERVHETMGKLVDTTNVDNMDVDTPAAVGDIAPAQATGACAVPSETAALAHQIENVTASIADPPNRKRRRDPWWTLEEEEEEEEDGAAGS
jgi:hypothetical protein